jgi:hypothetical protein
MIRVIWRVKIDQKKFFFSRKRYKEFALYRETICFFKGQFCRGQKIFALYRDSRYKERRYRESRLYILINREHIKIRFFQYRK